MINATSIVFIDSRLSNLEAVIAGLAQGSRWVVIDRQEDGLSQMARALSGVRGLSSIQVLSHGAPGSLLLGSGSISAETLSARADVLARLGRSLNEQGDLLLYGCDVGLGDEGRRFIELLAQLTGADVAASTDLSGSTALGGDWDLEASTGLIETAALSTSPALDAAVGLLATFTGTSGNDTLTGGADADLIEGLAGNDSLKGNDGNDTIQGGDGNDSVVGDAGNDLLVGGLGNDSIYPGDGSDTIDGAPSSRVPWFVSNSDFDSLYVQGGSSSNINLSSRTVTVTGLTGTDTYSGVEQIIGLSGYSDIVTGRLTESVTDYPMGGSSINLYLQGGNDTVSLTGYGYQQPQADGPFVYYTWASTGLNVSYSGNVGTVNYGSGTDTLINVGFISDSPHNDYIDVSGLKTNHFGYITDPYFDRSWNFLFMGRGGSDTVVGNGGTTLHFNDVTHTSNGLGINIDLSSGSASLSHLARTNSGSTLTNLGTLTFSGVSGLHGTKFADTLIGGDTLNFEGFRGNGGNDLIDGGSGLDRADYAWATAGMEFDLASGLALSGSDGADTLRGIEEIRTTRFNDVYDATGLKGGYISTTENVSSYWWLLNSYVDSGGNDLVIGNGATRADFGNSLVAITVDLGAGIADARLESDKSSPLYASMGRDTLSGVYRVRGSAFDDLLQGGGQGIQTYGARSEWFRGGAGSDTIDGLDGFDVSYYNNSPAAISVDMRLATGQVHDGWGFTDTLINVEALGGTAYNDVVTGSDNAADLLVFYGALGADSFDGGAGTGTISYFDDPAAVLVRLSDWVGASGSLPSGYTGSAIDGWGAIDVFKNVDNAEGSSHNDTIIGDANNNVIDGRGGSDSLDGAGGIDTLEFNQATGAVHVSLSAGRVYDDGQGLAGVAPGEAVEVDTITGFENVIGGYGNDTITGDANANWLRGEAGSDTITGNAGNDTLDGGTPLDLIGYTDGNVVSYTSSTAAVNVNLQTGTASDGFGGTDTLSNFFRVWGSNHNDTITGSDATTFEMFKGGGGNDTIDGGARSANPLDSVLIAGSASGAVVVNRSGGHGVNRVEYTEAGSAVQVDLQAGTASGGSGSDTLIRINQARGSHYNDLLQGSDGTDFAEEFEGWGGNDTIDGRGGFDVVRFMYGTGGAIVDLRAGRAYSDGFGGTDTLIGIEGLIGSSFDDQLLGDDQDNSLDGRDGNDLLYGSDGSDTLTGGKGDDTLNGGSQRVVSDQYFSSGSDLASYSSAGSGVVVRLGASGLTGTAVGDWSGLDTLIDIEFVVGSSYNDDISGTNRSVTEIFRGGAGDDTLRGGDLTGVDAGFSIVDYRSASGAVQVNLATGMATGADGNDVLIGMNGIQGGSHADSLTGDAGDNFLYGRLGDDTIDGGAGNDRAAYNSASGSVTINLAAGTATGAEGNDTLISIEHARGSEFDDLIIGSGAANRLEGRAGNDSVSAGAGNDTITAGFGNDTLAGQAGNDSLDGGQGLDTASFSGVRASYSLFTQLDGSMTVRDNRNSSVSGFDGTDQVIHVEHLAFADLTVDLTAGTVTPWFTFGSSQYALVRGPTWFDAKAQAEALGGHLVTISSDAENNFLTSTFAAYAERAWLGYNDLDMNGQWQWLRDESSSYTKWYNSPIFGQEPNNYDGTEYASVIYLVPEAPPLNTMPSHWNSAYAMLAEFGIVELPADPAPQLTSNHPVYHWKSHMLLSGVQVSSVSAHANAADSSLFDLREAAFDAATGTLIVQVWSTPSSASANFDFDVSSAGAISAGFTSALGSNWTVLTNTTNPAAISVSAFDGNLNGFATATQLGTLTLQYSAGTTAISALFSGLNVGIQTADNLSLNVIGQVTGTNGLFGLPDDGAATTAIKVSRSASDTGNAISSADALAALRIAVGLNPNADPDGAGPLQQLRTSPYQFMAADVNGSGTVTSADALAILRMAVRLPDALPNEWFFVEESRDFWNEVTQQYTLTRTSAAWDKSVVIDASASPPVGVVGVLKGDVNGSWSAPAGSVDLDTLDLNYFTNLANRMNVPTDQWGV